MIAASEIAALVMELAEEDRYGLYEIIWALNARYPTVGEADKVAAARPVVADLVHGG